MPTKVEEKLNILSKHGCTLVDANGAPRTCKESVEILCACGHVRQSCLSNIVAFEQFKCKTCIKIKESTQVKLKYNKNRKTSFEKRIISFNNKFEKANKYRQDFEPINMHNTIQCRECKVQKPLYRFYNRKGFCGGKEALCRTCENIQKQKRRGNQSLAQLINVIITSCKHKSKSRKNKGRIHCGEFNIDANYILDLYDEQNSRCYYSNFPLTHSYNDMNKLSIDRINSQEGYVQGNVQLVSSYVNWMKLDMDESFFLKNIELIYEYNNDSNIEDRMSLPICEEKMSKRINKLLKMCKASAKFRKKSRSRIECGMFDIDFEYIMELIIKQNNTCIYSGIYFDWDVFNDNPYQASIDRIDNDKGYIKGNIQIVCNVVNQMMSDLSHAEFMRYIEAIYFNRVKSISMSCHKTKN